MVSRGFAVSLAAEHVEREGDVFGPQRRHHRVDARRAGPVVARGHVHGGEDRLQPLEQRVMGERLAPGALCLGHAADRILDEARDVRVREAVVEHDGLGRPRLAQPLAEMHRPLLAKRGRQVEAAGHAEQRRALGIGEMADEAAPAQRMQFHIGDLIVIARIVKPGVELEQRLQQREQGFGRVRGGELVHAVDREAETRLVGPVLAEGIEQLDVDAGVERARAFDVHAVGHEDGIDRIFQMRKTARRLVLAGDPQRRRHALRLEPRDRLAQGRGRQVQKRLAPGIARARPIRADEKQVGVRQKRIAGRERHDIGEAGEIGAKRGIADESDAVVQLERARGKRRAAGEITAHPRLHEIRLQPRPRVPRHVGRVSFPHDTYAGGR